MLEAWTDRKRIISMRGRWGVMGSVSSWLGIIFAILGIVADAANVTLGLEPTSWFLLAIAAFAVGIAFYISWALGMHLEATEAKKKE